MENLITPEIILALIGIVATIVGIQDRRQKGRIEAEKQRHVQEMTEVKERVKAQADRHSLELEELQAQRQRDMQSAEREKTYMKIIDTNQAKLIGTMESLSINVHDDKVATEKLISAINHSSQERMRIAEAVEGSIIALGSVSDTVKETLSVTQHTQRIVTDTGKQSKDDIHVLTEAVRNLSSTLDVSLSTLKASLEKHLTTTQTTLSDIQKKLSDSQASANTDHAKLLETIETLRPELAKLTRQVDKVKTDKLPNIETNNSGDEAA